MKKTERCAQGAIFCAKPAGFTGGRDPLGIQNSSVACYAALLPGLTNLTSHIRYYSIYAWLIEEYNRAHRDSNTTAILQRDFIRRAELLIAKAMSGKGVKAVIGADFIYDGKLPYRADALVDLAKGADFSVEKKNSKNLYWSFPLGAFGQYYLGSLINLGIVDIDTANGGKRFYTRRKDLHEAFVLSTQPEARTAFLQAVESGTFDTELCHMISENFGPHKIRPHSPEWELLGSMMFTPDDSQILPRRATAIALLGHLAEGGSTDDFPATMFRRFSPDAPEVVVGWSYYYLAECLHYAAEALFWFFLDVLNELCVLPVEGYSGILAHEAGITPHRELPSADDICSLMARLKKHVKQNNSREAAKVALAVFISVQHFLEQESIAALMGDFEAKAGLRLMPGALMAYSSRCAVRPQHSAADFMSHVIARILNDHSATAARKMRGRDATLHKFEIDDGYFRCVQVRKPQFTSPRLGALRNFLEDLKYINGDKFTSIDEA
ncbi:MAG: hypothetical protein NC418_10575 [Muribaculaceae bacterium]|nr:hypothetical protein [Muribaculaceae bacterium]